MRAKYAKQIRIGIMFMCTPIFRDNPEDDYDRLDIARLSQIQYDYFFNGSPLAEQARFRTKPWTSVRYTDD